MSNYEQVIRQVRYCSRQPTERTFRLTCSELNGRYTSNEFNLEVSEACSDAGRMHHLLTEEGLLVCVCNLCLHVILKVLECATCTPLL